MGKEKMEKLELRRDYRNIWHSDLMSTMTADAPYCCFATWCAPCASFLLRKRALYDDMSRYTCCGGFMPCSGKCGERKCPALCLCTEVTLCFPNSVASTRFMLQDEFNIRTTKCDNCIIGFMICVDQLACIFSILACILGSDEINDTAHVLNCISEFVYCTVCACMQTQHKIEMDKRDGMFGPAPVMSVPPMQQMSRTDQPYPPAVAYYPQQPQHPPLFYGHHPPPYSYPSPPSPYANAYSSPPPPHAGYPQGPPPTAYHQGPPPASYHQGPPPHVIYPQVPPPHAAYPQGTPPHAAYPHGSPPPTAYPRSPPSAYPQTPPPAPYPQDPPPPAAHPQDPPPPPHVAHSQDPSPPAAHPQDPPPPAVHPEDPPPARDQ